MSKEDFEVFKDLRRERQEERRKRREEFKGGPGWKKHSETHYTYNLNGEKLQYWPGPKKFHFMGKTMHGDVEEFIRKQENG